MAAFRWREGDPEAGRATGGEAPAWTAGHPASVGDNRAGRMAAAQRAALAWRAMTLLVAAAASAVAFAAVTDTAPAGGGTHAAEFFLLVITAVLLVFGGPLLVDVMRGRVIQVEGPLTVRALYRGGTRVLVGERSFRVGNDILERVRTGSTYRVYYTPLSRRIVNYERLESRTD